MIYIMWYLMYILYEVHSTIILSGDQVSDFAGNLRAQKLNKAQKKRANTTSIKYF